MNYYSTKLLPLTGLFKENYYLLSLYCSTKLLPLTGLFKENYYL